MAEFRFDIFLITFDVAADSLMTLQALNVRRLQKIGAIIAKFIREVITHNPLNLGQGIWLNDSSEGTLFSAVTVSCPVQIFDKHG